MPRVVTYRFEEVTCTAYWHGPCERCGRKVRRQYTFAETVNPFHPVVKNNPGRSDAAYRRMIRDGLREKARDWRPTHVVCSRCA